MGFLKSPEIPLEGLIKIPFEGNFFRFPREEEKTRTKAVGFLKSPEIPLEDTYFTPLHVADLHASVYYIVSRLLTTTINYCHTSSTIMFQMVVNAPHDNISWVSSISTFVDIIHPITFLPSIISFVVLHLMNPNQIIHVKSRLTMIPC